MSKRFCICGKATEGFTCDACKATNNNRLYGRPWRRLRAEHINDQPTCVDCEAEGLIGIPADEVHHHVPVNDSEALRLEKSNLVSLCVKHHKMRHNRAGILPG